MTAELKPCPFCGGDKNTICKTDYDGRDSYAVSCRYPECHGAIFTLGYGYFPTVDQAIAAWNTRAVDHAAIREAALMRAYKEGWSDGAANYHHDRNETPDDGWLISDTYKSIPIDAAAALEERYKQVRDDTVRSAAIAAGNAIVAIAADADPDISPLRKQMLRVKMEKAVKAAFTRDA